MDPYLNIYLSPQVNTYMNWCVAYMHRLKNDKSTDAMSFRGKRPLPEISTLNYLISLCVGINFIDTWLRTVVYEFAYSCCSYQYNSKNLKKKLKNRPQLLKTSKGNVRHFWLILEVDGTWASCVTLDPPQRKQGWVGKQLEQEKIKDQLKVAFDHWKY